MSSQSSPESEFSLLLFLRHVTDRYELCVDATCERSRDDLSPHERNRPDRPGAAAVLWGAVEPAGKRQQGGSDGPAEQHGVHHVRHFFNHSKLCDQIQTSKKRSIFDLYPAQTVFPFRSLKEAFLNSFGFGDVHLTNDLLVITTLISEHLNSLIVVSAESFLFFLTDLLYIW